ncbi:hypothetical protein ACWGOQ_0006610 [Aquimarina sp. M1]
MNVNFFNALKEGNVELTKDQLKQIHGGDGIVPVAGVAITCGDGNVYTCTGTDCTGTDNVGCSCDNGTDSVSCKDHQN